MYETGHFASPWKNVAQHPRLRPEFIGSDWRGGVKVECIESRLREDSGHSIKAVCVVHNETSTRATSRIDEVRKAIDATGHPALLLVDTVSGLACADYRHDEWDVDVSVSGPQRGRMLPPGLGFNAVSKKALAFARKAETAKQFWLADPERLACAPAEAGAATRSSEIPAVSTRNAPRARSSLARER